MFMAAVAVACVIRLAGGVHPRPNNVCRTFGDYATIDTNENCWYNPDIESTPSVIARRHGYPFEKHKVTTEDGYILTLFRIPNNKKNVTYLRQPVLVQHGLGGISEFWFMRGKESLAFVLSNNGYDVWLANGRGTIHSADHARLSRADPAYWDFGFHEMGVFDIPAMAEKISNVTGRRGDIIYIGHSMGSTASYIYSSVMADHAEKYFKGFISLAPVAYMSNAKGLLRIFKPFFYTLRDFVDSLGIQVLLNYSTKQKRIFSKICGSYPTVIYCSLLGMYAVGAAAEQVDPEIPPFFFRIYPNGISTRILKHYLQFIMNENTFNYYDYGNEKNLFLYNSTNPPDYPIESISLPFFLFVGKYDYLGDLQDAEHLYKRLSSPRTTTKVVEKYTFNMAHNDFFYGKNIKKFHSKLLEVMRKLNC